MSPSAIDFSNASSRFGLRLNEVLLAKSTVIPPDTFFGRQIRIERLCDGGPERVEDAGILLASSHALEVTIQALGTAPGQLRHRMDAEGLQIAFDGPAYRPQVPESARLSFARTPAPWIPTTAS